MRYRVGSTLLGLSNNHDVDFIVLCDGNETTYERKREGSDDVLYRSVQNIKKYMNFEYPITRQNARIYVVNYQLDANIISQNFPVEYHILDRRIDYIHLLLDIVNNKLLNFKRIPCLNNGCMSKILYHVAYTTFIMQNNSTTLTAEQKEIVQKIHDRQMPQDYLDELEEIIRGLR